MPFLTNMKRYLIIILLLSASLLTTAWQLPRDFSSEVPEDLQGRMQVQTQRSNQDEVESRKIAFLSAALNLTPAEAALFWPVYNEWSNKLDANMKARHEALQEIRRLNREKKTDEKAYAKLSKQLVDGAAEEAAIISEAHKVYVSLIGEVRTAQLYLAEEQFRGMLIRELRQSTGRGENRSREP